jgi:hypothetical protein
MMRAGERQDRRNWHFWLIAKDESGKPYLIAGGKTEEEARQKGLEMLSGQGIDFAIRRLPTIDLGRASSMIKGQRLEKTKSLSRATEKLGHDRSLSQRRKRQQQRQQRQQGGF